MLKRTLCLLVLVVVSTAACNAQSTEDAPTIQDNSFLVEEAYNQEFGVVQHIQTFQRLWQSKDWAYTFTPEWPYDPAPRHQLSYTMPVLFFGSNAQNGIGDIALNYRYQLVGDGKAKIAVAPRATLLLPTGDSRRELGAGGPGVQLMLPASVVFTKHWVTHWNIGTTIVPRAKSPAGAYSATYGYNLGQSIVWLARPRFNLLLETVFNSSESVIASHQTQRSNDVFLNPGARWAYNFKNGLQIVPGVSVPIGFAGSSGERGLFLYLSLEHPDRKIPKKD